MADSILEETKCHPADTAVHIIAARITVHTARHITAVLIRAAEAIQAAAATRVIHRAIIARMLHQNTVITEAVRLYIVRGLLNPTVGTARRLALLDIFMVQHMIMIIIRRHGRRLTAGILKKAIMMRTVSITII